MLLNQWGSKLPNNMGKTKIKKIEDSTQSSVLGDQLSESSQSVVGLSGTEKQKTGKPKSKNRKQKTDNRVKVRSKKYQAAVAGMEKGQKLPALAAVEQTQKGSYSKFEGTIEAHLNTNTKNLRGLVNMPFAQGHKLRILAFGDLKETEGVTTGNDNTIAEIDKGKVDFDMVVTTPEWMPKLAKVARILGPRSLMPNPKNGTISENLEKTITELQGGKTEYKTEANGQVIHLAVGKVNQNPEEIVANLKVIYNTVGRSKIQKISLAPTMGPSVKVDLSSLS